jgi:archaellum component FlaF (FlaF/FlaG flagellin family)
VGFSVAAAAAVVFTAVAVAGTHATGTLLDSWSRADAAQQDALRQSEAAARTGVTVTSVTHDGGSGVTTVVADNSGSVTLDAREVDVLADGVLATLASVEVEGSATKYAWAPGLELTVTFTSADPDAIAVVPETGTPGYWRS